ncbi:MAG: leucine--tRNA ligase [Bacteroidota bacterium]|nr:leucine--tRNA ligase [Bacteroidota bacterium]
MKYNFREIEKKWQEAWKSKNINQVNNKSDLPKHYVLDMFPYPSGAGLHVGHPLGYIASDIYTRYKKQKGYNVLHPMGFDAFGLPAEQYAVQTGMHPAITTEKNIKRYKEQLNKIGLSFDWSREVVTSDPKYYKWTQWAFLQMFKHWFDNKTQKAQPIENLIQVFEESGSEGADAACTVDNEFTAEQWKAMSEKEQMKVLMNYRLAYRDTTSVNWCPALGTVLANDEVQAGVSERGGHPVFQKDMEQWLLRVSAYSERLLSGMESLDWSDSLKDLQRNWIGRSEGAAINFKALDTAIDFDVFTTRPDTIFGSTFMVLAPESELTNQLTTKEHREEMDAYIEKTKMRTERDRQADAENITGVFTGSYALNPFTEKKMPIWVSDYVLAGYGTGAIMAVPAHDSRDYKFAKHFDLEIIPVVTGGDIEQGSYDAKEGKMINSGLINGLEVNDAILKIIEETEQRQLGTKTINFRIRDAIFSRQRYWGEPFPVYYKDDVAYPIPEEQLPLKLPEIDEYKPTEDGDPPLGRAHNWQTEGGFPYELSTMPGFAGSSAYYLRYMDPQNDEELVSEEANSYWQDVDLYIGGTEHAVGHLIYSRFWNKFLYDIGKVVKDEPFKRLVNQGMIRGRSNFVYRIKNTNKFVSYNLRKEYETTRLHVDVNIVDNDILDIEAFKTWRSDFNDAEFITEDDGNYHCGSAEEKMSKSLHNVVNPDVIIEQYGADTLRLYEMFLGPIEQSKPWDTNGIEGVYRFLNKLWRLFFNNDSVIELSEETPNNKELKVLHKTIKKVQEDVERLAFNTSVSAFMVCVNELYTLKCNKRSVLEQLLKIIAPFAPHIAEELWEQIGNTGSVTHTQFPDFDEKYLKEDSIKYPVAFNGKTRFTVEVDAEISREDLEKLVLEHDDTTKRLQGKSPKKVIIVPKRMVNIVV